MMTRVTDTDALTVSYLVTKCHINPADSGPPHTADQSDWLSRKEHQPLCQGILPPFPPPSFPSQPL